MKIDRDKILIIIASVLVLIFGVLYFFELNRGPAFLSRNNEVLLVNPAGDPAGTDAVPASITVHVAGEVKRPGVYDLKSGSRVRDALELAGGPTDEADLNRINLAAYISDAQQIFIPGARAGGGQDDYFNEENSKLININTADRRLLMTLPGIGDVIAGNIIAYREKNGDFKNISDIKNVLRIGDRIFEQIQDMIAVE